MPPPLDAFASRRYALVIDAGSSGSRLQIYSWRDPKAERQLVLSSSLYPGKGKEKETAALRRLPKVEKGVQDGMGEWQKKVEPGVSSLASMPITYASVTQYFAPLLSHAVTSIPPSHHQSTPIYILATAGMRLLPSDLSSELIKTTCQVLQKDYPFLVGKEDEQGPCGESVRIISGEEEGLWGWVAVNYLMDGFGEPTQLVPSSASLPPSSKVHPFGFLDMGGASTQIAFAPSDSQASSHRSSLSSVKLRLLSGEDLDYDVFVASWLGYGTNRARERYVGTLVDQFEASRSSLDKTVEPHISDPCLPRHLTLQEVPKLPQPTSSILSPEALDHASLPHVLKGTGSFPQCLRSLQPLLNKHLPCPTNQPHQCLFDALPTPKIDFDHQRFIGVSEYWYSSEHVFNLGGAWDFEEFEKKAGEFCGMDWEDIQEKWINGSDKGPKTGDGEVLDGEGRVVETGKWGPEVEIPRLQMQCFKAAWLVNVLHEGIGLPRTIDPHPTSYSAFDSTESEASAKALEKNLGPSVRAKHRPAFQSLDSVGNTAISWTLGKMVIEASRDVSSLSAGSLSEGKWPGFPANFQGIHGIVKERLDPIGAWSYVLYLGILLGVVSLFLTKFKRKFTRSPKMMTRRWRRGTDEGLSPGYTSSEDDSGGGSGFLSRSRTPTSSSKWPSKLSSHLRRMLFPRPERPRLLKQTRSAPMLMRTSTPPRPNLSSFSSFLHPSSSFPMASPPSSPRRSFRPPSDLSSMAAVNLSSHSMSDSEMASSPPLSSKPMQSDSASLPTPPPPRPSRRSPQTTSGGVSVDFHLTPLREILKKTLPTSSLSAASPTTAIAGDGPNYGWNDPPMDLLGSRPVRTGPATSPNLTGDDVHTGVLTPPATTSSLAGSMMNSRNSSRVDLNGLGGGLTGRTGLREFEQDHE